MNEQEKAAAASRLAEHLARYAGNITDQATHPDDRYLLIERARLDGTHYLTTHDNHDEAGAYHASQEYPEDWEVIALVDLITGARWDAQYAVRWEPTPTV